LREREKR